MNGQAAGIKSTITNSDDKTKAKATTRIKRVIRIKLKRPKLVATTHEGTDMDRHGQRHMEKAGSHAGDMP